MEQQRTETGKSLETKLAILAAFDELCKTRPFSRLGVADMTKATGISRSRFYYHFKDRNDAVRWISCYAFERGVDQTGRTLSWFEGHYRTTRILFEYRHLISAAAEDASYSGAALFYQRHRTENLRETLRLRGVEVTEGLDFQARALAACEQNLTVSFIRGEFGEMTARAFCEHLASVVPSGLREALAFPADRESPALDENAGPGE